MNRKLLILYTVIVAIILSISTVIIVFTFFAMSFFYDYTIWCDKEEMQYLKEEYGIYTDFKVAVCKVGWRARKYEVYIFTGYPSLFGEKVKIQGSAMVDYIRENRNNGEVAIKCSMPYIILNIVLIIIWYKALLPKYAEENS